MRFYHALITAALLEGAFSYAIFPAHEARAAKTSGSGKSSKAPTKTGGSLLPTSKAGKGTPASDGPMPTPTDMLGSLKEVLTGAQSVSRMVQLSMTMEVFVPEGACSSQAAMATNHKTPPAPQETISPPKGSASPSKGSASPPKPSKTPSAKKETKKVAARAKPAKTGGGGKASNEPSTKTKAKNSASAQATAPTKSQSGSSPKGSNSPSESNVEPKDEKEAVLQITEVMIKIQQLLSPSDNEKNEQEPSTKSPEQKREVKDESEEENEKEFEESLEEDWE